MSTDRLSAKYDNCMQKFKLLNGNDEITEPQWDILIGILLEEADKHPERLKEYTSRKNSMSKPLRRDSLAMLHNMVLNEWEMGDPYAYLFASSEESSDYDE